MTTTQQTLTGNTAQNTRNTGTSTSREESRTSGRDRDVTASKFTANELSHLQILLEMTHHNLAHREVHDTSDDWDVNTTFPFFADWSTAQSLDEDNEYNPDFDEYTDCVKAGDFHANKSDIEHAVLTLAKELADELDADQTQLTPPRTEHEQREQDNETLEVMFTTQKELNENANDNEHVIEHENNGAENNEHENTTDTSRTGARARDERVWTVERELRGEH